MASKLRAANGLYYNITQLDKMLDQSDGTVSGIGVAVTQGVTGIQTAVFTATNLSVATVDNTTAGAQGSQKIFTFPAGNVTIIAATNDLTIARVGTALTATSAIVSSLGSVAASNADATLTSTEANIIPSTTATLTAGAGTVKGESTGAVTLDGTSTAAEVYLNFATPDAGSTGNDALTVNGTIRVYYLLSGDN